MFIGLTVTVLAANARSDGNYWSISRGLNLRRESLQKGLYPGIALMVIGALGAYRCLNAASSHRHRTK